MSGIDRLRTLRGSAFIDTIRGMQWSPATKQEVLSAIEADWAGIDPKLRARLTTYLIEPRSVTVERFGDAENAFVIAELGRHVVFFDDIEEEFGIAQEADGSLLAPAAYGNIAVALRELERRELDGG